MRPNLKSYLVFLILSLLILSVTTDARAASVYLNPDSVYVTAAIDTILIELRVDETVSSLQGFQIWFNIDPTMFSLVGEDDSLTPGLDQIIDFGSPLMEASGYSSTLIPQFEDDSTLRIDGVIWGSGHSTDGPGTLAFIPLLVVGEGASLISITDNLFIDVNRDTIAVDVDGAFFWINYPPTAFDLLSPPQGEEISGLPGEYIDFSWTSSSSVYDGEDVSYKLEYSTSADYEAGQTVTVDGLTQTTYSILVDPLSQATYYWRVTAVGDMYGFEKISHPGNQSFVFSWGYVAPDAFDLLTPGNGPLVDIYGQSAIFFDWEDAGSIIPDDTTTYHFYLGPNPGDPSDGALVVGESEDISHFYGTASSLPLGQWVYWRVNAVNKVDLNTWSTSTHAVMFYSLGDLNHDDWVDLGDLTALIDYLFISFTEPFPLEAANLDCGGFVDLGDLTLLIAYLFLDGPLDPCE